MGQSNPPSCPPNALRLVWPSATVGAVVTMAGTEFPAAGAELDETRTAICISANCIALISKL